jgi:hypothetical protein
MHEQSRGTMLIRFLLTLRAFGLKIGLSEFLMLLEALRRGHAQLSVDDFYHLARAALVKDEGLFDRYDRAFSAFFSGLAEQVPDWLKDVPADWLEQTFGRQLSDEEKAQLSRYGSPQELMDELNKRLQEQTGRHAGGNRWIGTGGTSAFGHGGYHPEGVRIGGKSQQGRATKVWEQRNFRNLDDEVELGRRNFQVALRRLRKFAREGAADELDLDGTIDATARNAGWLDLKLRPERHNAVKLLLFIDIGGSMDEHIRVCEELFSAAKAEFKHLEHYYFHNCLYERVWKDNRRRWQETTPTQDLLHKYPADYRVIFIGDASMSPLELLEPGGSVEHWNEEAGSVWLQRVLQTWPRCVWLNPTERDYWNYTPTIGHIRQTFSDRMYPLTLGGISEAIDGLRRTLTAARVGD